MAEPLVSVIIPTYNGASFLGRAIRSVLAQTYANLELIIVDDKSPDNTLGVVKQFDDPRIKYIRHEVNQGAASARGTGRRMSLGEIIAFLDQDDTFHPEKLKEHVAFLMDHPNIGFTYNSYFDLVHSSDAIRTVFRPPQYITLADLTLGFYLPPSSWVVRREWAFREDIWDANASLRGREIVVCGRLFMAGCEFAYVDKVLHYRGYHAQRGVKELEKNCNNELLCQELIFSDPRCPKDVLGLRPIANANIYMMWANVAFNQLETELGHKFFRAAIQLNPSLMLGTPPLFMNFLMDHCVDDESQDYEVLLEKLFSQLPPDIPNHSSSFLWAVSRGYLVRGVRAILWSRPEDARRYFSKIAGLKFEIDEELIQQITHELLGYELCFGAQAAFEMLSEMCTYLKKINDKRWVNWLIGSYLVNKANREYNGGNRWMVPGAILGAIMRHPKYLFNHGVIVILIKSIAGVMPVV